MEGTASKIRRKRTDKVQDNNGANKEPIMVKQERLTEVQFYKWRAAVEKLLHSDTKLQLSVAKHSILEKDKEISAMKSALYYRQVEDSKNDKLNVIKEYDQILNALEKELGRSLKGAIVNEETYEITEDNSSK